jgi:hypothetical protein
MSNDSSTALAERTERIESPIYGAIVPIAAIQQNIVRIQTAKQEVMKKDLHYGTIPGTPKPTLYKAGAEIINLMFGVSVDPADKEEEDGVDDTGVRFYRAAVRMVFKSRLGGFLGASWGYASSLEEKYKWRRATGKREFEATPEARRRVKFKRGQNNSEYEEMQIRTEVDDIKNTVLQIAMKRAEVSGTRRVHALSDMFGQDLEDLPAEIRDSIIDGEVVGREDEKKPVQPGQRRSQQNDGNGKPAGEAAAEQQTNAPIGKVQSVEEKKSKDGTKTYYAVRLTTGFGCTTWSKTVADEARAHKEADHVVEMVTEQKDPKFPPTLRSIKVPETKTAETKPADTKAESREPGQEG